jgi:hypothetical protein
VDAPTLMMFVVVLKGRRDALNGGLLLGIPHPYSWRLRSCIQIRGSVAVFALLLMSTPRPFVLYLRHHSKRHFCFFCHLLSVLVKRPSNRCLDGAQCLCGRIEARHEIHDVSKRPDMHGQMLS